MFLEVWHKYTEITFESKFYDELEINKFVATTSFNTAEFIQERGDYFRALRK
jgi:hypothetical protein